ncbi:MAG TPA: CusA/CzcA family heavy metal efflux RND transporter [Bacteroidales bacterium]|nr:CusA/CzcA family heavy metal efflux RND transporter [Bacteroidales bacterium]
MIERVIHFSIRNKFIIGLFTIALVCWGSYSLSRLPVDAIPDITNNQVQIIAIAPSLAVQEVESFITSPVEVAVSSIPDILELRSISRLGLSVVTVVFDDDVDVYWARQQLNERLKEAEESIPEGVAKIELAPISTGLGEIYQYRLAVAPGLESKYNPMELRTIQDWIVRRQMLGTPGVADINSYGGFVKQYEISVNPEILRGMDLTLTDIFEALERNNENTGSAYIDKKPSAYFIRGIGLVKSLEDIEQIVVKTTSSGLPVLIRDVARVQFGAAIRYGAFVVDTTEAVGGVVMMLKGANAHKVIDQVQSRIKIIQKSLPDGVSIEPYLNRSDLVGRAIGTVSENLIIGALIVVFVLVLLLGNLRAGLIVASVIPLAMLFAISMMNLFGVSGNLMSLGAIDFGLIIDGAVIIVESVVHRITLSKHHHQGIETLSQEQMDENVFDSARKMMSSATFGQIIILIVYLPIMALTGIEGKMFRPMAQVVVFALLGATILSLTYVPMASALFLSKKTIHTRNISDKLIDLFHRVFNPIIRYALNHKRLVSISALILFIISLFIFSKLGGEFIPQLEEGDLAAGVMTLQGGSLSNTIEQVEKANKILLTNFPEIKHAVCKIGAGEIPTDPTPMETGDYIITLKPKKEWTSANNREDLVALMEEKLVTLAGVKFEFQQPIQMRFNELMTGSKQDVAVKLYGDKLDVLAEKASEIEKLILNIKGVEDINVEKVTGLAQIQVEFKRERLAQYGLSIDEVNRLLRAAFAGSEAGVVFDEEKRFGLVVRLDRDYRQNLEDVKNLSVGMPGGNQIPFEQLADITIKSGPAQVSREHANRRITVGFNVRNRDVQTVINEVSDIIDRKISLPSGYYISYGGQFQNLQAAKNRLAIAVPVALLLIFVLLYFTFNSLKQTVLIYTAVPLSAIGGIFALWIRGMNFSISAGVGFIALFGVAVLNGIVLIAEFNRLEKEGIADITERVLKGLHTRLRPVIMTAAVASLGFMPMAISTSAGAEVQKPLATVVIGGLITATFLTLVILPVFYIMLSRFSLKIKLRGKSSGMASFLILLLLATFINNSLRAQEKINEKQAVEIALNNNLEIKGSTYETQALKALRGSSWDIPKTEVEAQYGQFNSYDKDNSISVSQSFSFPSLYINQDKLAGANYRSGQWLLKDKEIEIAAQVRQVYWQIAYLYSKQKLLLYQDSLFAGFLRAAELKANSGETNRLEMINARSQSLEIRNNLNKVSTDLMTYNQRLMILLNSDKPLVIADSAITIITIVRTDSGGIENNPKIAYMQEQVQVARMQKKVENSRIMPDLSIGWFSQTMKGTQDVNGIPREFGPGDRFTGFQAGISIPLWFVPWVSQAKAAKLRQQAAEVNAESYRKTISDHLVMLENDYKKFSATIRYYENQAIPEADLIIDQASRSYRAGAMDYNDYIMNLNRALTIRHSYLDAMNELNQTLINLDYITGKEF